MLSAPARRRAMPYNMAGIDVHKRMLHVVFSDVEVDGEYEFTRQVFGSSPQALRALVAWLVEHQVEEVVMESTAQWNQPRNTGNPCGERWSGIGNRSARVGKARWQPRELS